MIHGTAKSIAAGCTCNLCTLVRNTPGSRGPERRSVPAERIRAHLDALTGQGWTMTALAARLGYHVNTLYMIRAGKTLTVQVPEHGGFAVYDANGANVAASWAWGDTSAVLPEGGWVVFAGDPGVRFHLALTEAAE